MQLFVRAQTLHTIEVSSSETVAQIKVRPLGKGGGGEGEVLTLKSMGRPPPNPLPPPNLGADRGAGIHRSGGPSAAVWWEPIGGWSCAGTQRCSRILHSGSGCPAAGGYVWLVGGGGGGGSLVGRLH